MSVPTTFAAKLRALRESHGLTVQELAEQAGVSRQAVHDLEAGKSKPSWATVQALAGILGVGTDTFRDPA